MMSLKNWFEQRRKQSTAHLDAEGMNRVEDAQYAKIWTQCVSCQVQGIERGELGIDFIEGIGELFDASFG